jgi:hypothetical protein
MQRALSLLVAAVSALAACGSPCGGRERSTDVYAPEITAFEVLPSELGADPWTVFLGITFTDANGDLGNSGHTEVFIDANDEPAIQEELREVFQRSNLELDAARGEFWVAVVFGDGSMQDGSTVRTSIQLVDGAALRSNCYSLDLQFQVASLDGTTPRWRVANNRCGGKVRRDG